jgi:hypothetical protein
MFVAQRNGGGAFHDVVTACFQDELGCFGRGAMVEEMHLFIVEVAKDT